MTQDFNPARRRILHGAGALAVAGAMPLAARAQTKQIVVSDPGGPYTTAYREAFYDPFEKATGIKVVSVARESQPVAQFAAMVQTKNYVWDVTTLTLSADIPYLEAKGLLRTLADPNLTTLSGGSASFLAGGQVPIRVPDANGNSTVTYKDFGVKLNFTPVVLDGNRIQIRLTPEVSDIASFTSAGDPVFTTRNLDATVELRDGQSFSVAGLMQSHTKLSQNQLPWLGDVPVIGSLFKSQSYQKDETELVVIVTPRLVQPSSPSQHIATPLDQTAPANDGDFFIGGQMELARQAPFKPRGTPRTGYILNMGDGK